MKSVPILHRHKTKNKINTLLIDGEVLLKQGFYGSKQVKTENGTVYTIYHFINTIKRFYVVNSITKVVVFWEGNNSKSYRQSYYPYYKANRKDKVNLDEEYDLERQRLRIKAYLDELFIRQVEVDNCEADDAIAHYCVSSPGEKKIIYTNDRDLLQLLSDDVSVYLYGKKVTININNFRTYFNYHYKNIGLIKIISGDTSDNISGLIGIGEDTVLKTFPELITTPKDINWIINRTKELIENDPKSKRLQTILEGKTKWGSYGGDEYFNIMDKIINLKTPNKTDELIKTIDDMVNDSICPDGRGGVKKVMQMLNEDQLLFFFPNNDENFSQFWASFTTIINKELQYYKNKQ